MNLKEARIKAGLTQKEMSEQFEIPKRTIENWEMGIRSCPRYVEKLILEKLEGMIMMKSREILEKAMELNKFGVNLPELEIGQTVELNEVWDGEGDVPDSSYSYLLTDKGEDGDGNMDISLNYEFEVIEENDDPLKTLVKITDIYLV